MKYRNISSWGNTTRFQFRLAVLGEVFYGFDYASAKDAAFACDVCKSILLHFNRPVDKRTKLALDEQDFASLCRAEGLDPVNPTSLLSSSAVPDSFRDFVKPKLAQWEDELQSKGPSPNAYLRYARASEDQTIRTWAWAYEFALYKQKKLGTAPRVWWSNILNAVKKNGQLLKHQLRPSFEKIFSEQFGGPEFFQTLSNAETAARRAAEAALELEQAINKLEESLALEFQQLESNRPDVFRNS